jgi:hypothetical protein
MIAMKILLTIGTLIFGKVFTLLLNSFTTGKEATLFGNR